MPAPRPDARELVFRHQEVQRLRRLVARRTARDAERCFVVEGAKVLSAALDAGVRVETVYLDATAHDHEVALADRSRARVRRLASGVLERVAGTVTPQGVIAVVPYVDVPLSALRGATLVLVCVDVRDPGNAGTILRSAEGAGAEGVICCTGSVDVFNPKSVRASAGSLFHVPVVAGGEPTEVLEDMARWGIRRLATVAQGGADYDSVDLTTPVAFVLGNEAHGLPAAVEGSLDGTLTIPMAGRTRSLNVGIAAAVLSFEAARQRRAAA